MFPAEEFPKERDDPLVLHLSPRRTYSTPVFSSNTQIHIIYRQINEWMHILKEDQLRALKNKGQFITYSHPSGSEGMNHEAYSYYHNISIFPHTQKNKKSLDPKWWLEVKSLWNMDSSRCNRQTAVCTGFRMTSWCSVFFIILVECT